MAAHRRIVSALAVVAVLLASLSGCSVIRRDPTPYDAGIPAARAAAEQQRDDLRARVDFSSRVTVLGSTSTDDCDTIRKWWFDDIDLGYQCTLHTRVIAAIPDAGSRLEVAAAVDAEMVDIDLPYPTGAMVQDLESLHPAVRDELPMHGEAADGAATIGVSAEPFRAEFWPPVATSGMVSGGWDGSPVTAGDFAATGAPEVVVVSIDIEYWNTDGLPDVDYIAGEGGVSWVVRVLGDAYAFELGYAVPDDAADVCLADPLIDQSTIRRDSGGYSLLAFELRPEAQEADSDRIRACIDPLLTSGTALQLLPGEPPLEELLPPETGEPGSPGDDILIE